MANRRLLVYTAIAVLAYGLCLPLQAKVQPLADRPLACDPPFDLSTSNITETEADLRWDVKPDGIGVNVQYAIKGTGAWQDVGSEVTDKFLKITGLQPGTEYEWRVQTACADGAGSWVISSFSTPGSRTCPAPFNLKINDLSGNRASVGWTAFQGSRYYEVEYRADSSSTWIRSSLLDNTMEIDYIDSLQPLTRYRWRVRMVCDNGPSDWADSSFTTTNGAPIDAGISLLSNFSFKPADCKPTEIIFANTSEVTRTTITQLLWNFGDGTTSTDNDPVHNYTRTGSYDATLTIADNSGRTSAKTYKVNITQLSLKFASAGRDITVCSKDAVQLNASGGIKYEWQPCSAMNDCNSATPSIIPGSQPRYFVKVTNDKGCIDTASLSVRYIDPSAKALIPNAFTPDRNGVNDIFRPMANAGISNGELIIMDRWGSPIPISANEWDGNSRGKPMPSGNYTYIIKMKGNAACADKTIKGTVMLIR